MRAAIRAGLGGRVMASLLTRWTLYRRWGPRGGWTGNNAHDVTVSERSDGRWVGEGWSTCRCGKVRQVRSTAGWDEDSARRCVVLAGELCRACRAWSDRRTNRCSEGNCRLTYDHRGRCVPYPKPTPEMLATLRAANANPDPRQDGRVT